MQSISTEALVLSETTVGDNDKIITLLSGEYGKLSAICKGVKVARSGRGAASSLLSYSDVTLRERKGVLYLSEAKCKRSFIEVSKELSRFSLACYITSVLSEFTLEGQEQGEQLRLALNLLHALEKRLSDCEKIRAVFELRFCALSGLAPSLELCSECEREGEHYHLDLSQGGLICDECLMQKEEKDGEYLPVCPAVIDAMRYIISAPEKRILAFSLGKEEAKELSAACEKYFIYRFEKSFSTLDYYKKMLD